MNNEAQSITAASAVEPAAGPVQRINMVFFSPGKLGEHLRQDSPWFWTLAIVAIVTAVAWLLFPSDFYRAVFEAQMAGRPQPQGGPDPETLLKFARYMYAGFALVIVFIFAVIVAGAAYLVFNLVLGQEHSFRQHLSAAAHIYWIVTLGFLLTIPILLAKQDLQMRLGLGLLLPDSPSSFPEHVLNSITLFGLFSTLALGAVESGLSGGRVSLGKATVAVLGLYLLLVVLFGGWSTLLGA